MISAKFLVRSSVCAMLLIATFPAISSSLIGISYYLDGVAKFAKLPKIQQCKSNTCMDLPEKCKNPNRCTEKEIVEICFYNETWKRNGYSKCHEVMRWDKRRTNRKRKQLLKRVRDDDKYDTEMAAKCVMKDIDSKICNNLQALKQKNTLSRREARQLTIVKNMEEALSQAEKCYYDLSWVNAGDNHPCRIIASKEARRNLDAIQKRERIAYEEVRLRDERDYELVHHCFVFHQIQHADKCRGLVTDEPIPWVKSELRSVQIKSLWSERKRMHEYCTQPGYMAKDVCMFHSDYPFDTYSEENVQVLKCLYDNSWTKERNHICHSIANATKSNDEHTARLQTTYKMQLEKNAVLDCFKNHRNENYIGCRNITWNETGKLRMPVNEMQRKMWAKLEALFPAKSK